MANQMQVVLGGVTFSFLRAFDWEQAYFSVKWVISILISFEGQNNI